MNLGLEELYRRHLPLHDDEIVGNYDTGPGYSKPERSAEAEQESFATCLATTDEEVFYAGDHDRPFALQALSKVFVYGLALEAHRCDRVLVRVGAERRHFQLHRLRRAQ